MISVRSLTQNRMLLIEQPGYWLATAATLTDDT